MPFVGVSWDAGDNGIGRVFDIGTAYAGGAGHGDAVVVSCAALSTHEVVVFPALGQMGGLNAPAVRAAPPDPPGIAPPLCCFGGRKNTLLRQLLDAADGHTEKLGDDLDPVKSSSRHIPVVIQIENLPS